MKFSATLLDFAKPVLEALPRDAPLETQREALSFAILVWNALAVSSWGRPEFVTELRKRLGTEEGNDFITSTFDRLIQRKQQHYANDDRAVGKWELRLKHDGSITLRVEARGTPTK